MYVCMYYVCMHACMHVYIICFFTDIHLQIYSCIHTYRKQRYCPRALRAGNTGLTVKCMTGRVRDYGARLWLQERGREGEREREIERDRERNRERVCVRERERERESLYVVLEWLYIVSERLYLSCPKWSRCTAGRCLDALCLSGGTSSKDTSSKDTSSKDAALMLCVCLGPGFGLRVA